VNRIHDHAIFYKIFKRKVYMKKLMKTGLFLLLSTSGFAATYTDTGGSLKAVSSPPMATTAPSSNQAEPSQPTTDQGQTVNPNQEGMPSSTDSTSSPSPNSTTMPSAPSAPPSASQGIPSSQRPVVNVPPSGASAPPAATSNQLGTPIQQEANPAARP
jgi:hypothetical protein